MSKRLAAHFADSSLERHGFERSVPRLDRQQFVVLPELGPIYRRTVIRAVAGLGEPIELSGGVRGAATHARIRRRHTKVALSAVRAPRGTASSNQSLSCEESDELVQLGQRVFETYARFIGRKRCDVSVVVVGSTRLMA